MLPIKSVLFLTMLALLVFLVGAPAQPVSAVRDKPAVALANELIQQFPTNDAMKTAWKVHWATSTGFGLYIQDAWFKRDPKEPWLQVLGDAEAAPQRPLPRSVEEVVLQAIPR